MIVRCIQTAGAALEPPTGNGRPPSEKWWDVTPGAEYIVLGMGIFPRGLDLLIWDDADRPRWHPNDLFEMPTQPIPAHWEFALHDGIGASGGPIAFDGLLTCWGYPELVRNLQHHVDLQAREPEALQICREEFERRRHERHR